MATKKSAKSEGLTPVFTLRAEDLSEDELVRWTGKVANDDAILTRLKGTGAKVLVGPRGSGKSNYLRRAYFDLRRQGFVVAAYVNFSSHLALEPLMLGNPRALEIFRQWLIYKIIIGVDECEGPSHAIDDLTRLANAGRAFMKEVQTKVGIEPDVLPPQIAPSQLLEYLEAWTHELGKARCVLLMDDAAHAFMPQQQREFFELFRALRSRHVACKAAVYPGVTSYSPFFNVGHEAEQIEIWIEPDAATYLESMHAIFRARFNSEIQRAIRPELVDLAAYGAFGLPRNFITILEDVLELDEIEDGRGESVKAPTFPSMREAIGRNAQQVRQLFQEIAEKLPRYRNFVDVGGDLEGAMLRAIRMVNLQRSLEGSDFGAVGLALSLPMPSELDRVISLLEYSGVVRRTGIASRGPRGQYEKVQLHSSLLISENVLGLGRNPSADRIGQALKRRGTDDFVRRNAAALFDGRMAERCRLNLTPCFKCQTPRTSDDAQFCYKCGSPLTEQSVYVDLLQATIGRLRLTQTKLKRIHDNSNIRTVQDVLLDDRNAQLLAVPYVGPVWAARIRTRAEEFVSL